MRSQSLRARVPAGARTIVVTIVLLLFTLLFIIPFAWMISMSLRSSGDILYQPLRPALAPALG